MKLYNTLTRKKEDFKPLDGNTAKIYSCGPTVYSSASIGNMRAYIFADILKKSLELHDYNVLDVMNITDVGHLQSDADDGEDKVEQAAKKAKLDPADIAKKYTDEFFLFCDKLNIRKPKIIAPATKYIKQMIEHVQGLEKKGYTYSTSDGIYFNSSKFVDYYTLIPKTKEQAKNDKAGIRVSTNEKRNSNDFCVWRNAKPTALQKWQSPWGVGIPGWHIECSAIARHYLDDVFDIHTGGVDHIPIHHTNEIAQTQALTGKPPVKFWMHNEFIMINGGKMSKSLGNVYTIADLENRGFNPLAFRYFVLGAHYRTILNFTFDALKSAQTAYDNLVKKLAKHFIPEQDKSINPTSLLVKSNLRDLFHEALGEDLSTPHTLALIWEMVNQKPNRTIYNLIIEFDKVLSLGLEQAVQKHIENNTRKEDIPQLVTQMAQKRTELKKNKDFAGADKLREEIKTLGYEVVDTKEGFEIKKAT